MAKQAKKDPPNFSTREVPWMKVGTVIEKPLPADEAMALAGLDFDVELRAIGFQNSKKSGYLRFPGKTAIVRVDTEDPFGLASDDYEVVQYREAFQFIDEISPEIVAAGSLRKQRQAFMVVKHKDHVNLDVIDGDHHDLYVVLRTSHDCTRAVEVFIMPLRGRCMNQLPIATFGKNAQQRWSVRHVKGAQEKLHEAKKVILGLDAYAEEFAETAAKLASIDVELSAARDLLEVVLPSRPQTPAAIEKITSLFENAETVGYHGTGWGLVNAVSEYFDHHRVGGSPESRFTNAMQGQTLKSVNRTAQLLLRQGR